MHHIMELALSCYNKILLGRNDQLLSQVEHYKQERVITLPLSANVSSLFGELASLKNTYMVAYRFSAGNGCHLLQYLRQAKFQNERLMRWALTLQSYRFLFRAIFGRDNVAADCLGRNPLDDELLVISSCQLVN